MTLKIKHFIAKNGERFSQLYKTSSDGFPLFYPTAYCSRNLRSRFAHETQIEYLHALKKLYEWAEFYQPAGAVKRIDIHSRLITQKFFLPYEIDSLAAFVSLKKNSSDGSTLVGSKQNTMLTEIAKYLCWYADEVITDSNQTQTQTAITKMAVMINARKVKQGSRQRAAQEILDKKLTEGARIELLKLFASPQEGAFRSADLGARMRNVLALRILYDTGMRIGELLSLKLCDFNSASGGEPAILEVTRSHDDANDDRKRQPVAKTSGRPLPIEEELAASIESYLKDWRSTVPNVGYEDSDFIFVTHKKIDRQGRPLTVSSFNSGMRTLKKQRPALSKVHPHLLRHDWNYRFTLKAKALGYSKERARTLRESWMGWADNSPSSIHYDLRGIQEEAFEVGLKIMNDTNRRNSNNDKGTRP